jgi:protein-S-isoprenylcysteine O-methyltransferase Ste14
MIVLVQMLSGMLAVVLLTVAFHDDPPPWIILAVAAGLASWAGTWLYVRWRYGRGVKVLPSRPT